MNEKLLQAGIVGIGGYATNHHEAMLALEEEGLVKIRTTCDPKASELSAIREQLHLDARGVQIAPDFAGIFSGPLDLVNVAAPIHLHAMMHRACVENGAACYLEKPPTLNPVELASMIDLDRRAKKQAHVGFHLLHFPERLALKQRMISGEFGVLRRVAFAGTWQRALSYFQRNTWAGRLTMGDDILLDSCCANAMSHYVNAVLFFAGQDSLSSWAAPVRAWAELYRANAIQGTDTVFARLELDNGVECRIATTHACEVEHDHKEVYEFDAARVEIRARHDAVITFSDGREEVMEMPKPSLIENLRDYICYLNGFKERPGIRLEDCRPFVDLNALLYLGVSRIANIPDRYLRSIPVPVLSSTAVVIEGIGEVVARFAETGELPSEAGLPWSQPGGASKVGDIPRLDDALATIIAAG